MSRTSKYGYAANMSGYQSDTDSERELSAKMFAELGAPRTSEFFRKGKSVQVFQAALEEIGAERFVRFFIKEGDLDSALYAFDQCEALGVLSKKLLQSELADLVIKKGDYYSAKRFVFEVSIEQREKLIELILNYKQRGFEFFETVLDYPAQLTQGQFVRVTPHEVERVISQASNGGMSCWGDLRHFICHPNMLAMGRSKLLEYVLQSDAEEALTLASRFLTAASGEDLYSSGEDLYYRGVSEPAYCLSSHERGQMLCYVKQHDKKIHRFMTALFEQNLSMGERLELIFG